MKYLAMFAALIAAFGFSIVAAVAETPNPKPNILLIVADDLGFSDIGAYGSEIATPNIDALAAEGLKFSNFHALPTCAPSRASMMTGLDNHVAGMGSQLPTDHQKAHPGYEKMLSASVRTIPEVLRATGYRTYFSGKWHLGAEKGSLPIDRGFEETFAMMHGGGSHYADMIPLAPSEPLIYRRNGEIVPELPEDFYSTGFFTDQLLEWLERDKGNGTPFFASLSYTAPHNPLHAPQDYIAKYERKYSEGYQALRAQRFASLQELGLIPASQTLPPWPQIIPGWDELSPEQQALSQRDMEVYAAMVDYMDEQIGRVFTWLRENGQLDNTLIVFMSDNGAAGLSTAIYGDHDGEFASQFDNSLENRGLPGSFVTQGAGWATASTTAFKFFKGFSTEGGLRVPVVVKLPASVPSTRSAAANLDAFAHVQDILPTFMDISGAEHPSMSDPSIRKPTGKSLLPLLSGQSDKVYADNEGVGYEIHGARAYIQGDWKIMQSPMPMGDGRWELFNLKNDPAETTDLALQHREIRQELVSAHQAYEKENGVVYDLILVMAPAKKLNWAIIAFVFLSGATSLAVAATNTFSRFYRRSDTINRHVFAGLAGILLIGGAVLVSDYYRAGMLLIALAALCKLPLLISKRARWWLYPLWFLHVLAMALYWVMTSGLAAKALIG